MLGVDIGFSPKRPTGAICRLDWDGGLRRWTIQRFRYDPDERSAAIRAVAGDHEILAAAFDGPFRGDLTEIGVYRAAERALTRKIAPLIGKPGASSAPVGRRLNRATNEAVADVLELAAVGRANHRAAVHDRAVVEAFPNSFMGVMLPDARGLNKGRAGKSDRYYEALLRSGALTKLLRFLLPDGAECAPLDGVTQHDDRAALICAVSALCVASENYVAVGDDLGRIVLPPRAFWNPAIFDLVAANCATGQGDAAMHVGGL